MTDQSELNSRAALSVKLAQREPANRTFWMAEAENWSRPEVDFAVSGEAAFADAPTHHLSPIEN